MPDKAAISLLQNMRRKYVLHTEGESMHPFIKSGEPITVVPVKIEDVGPGDIIIFNKYNSLIAHRILGKFEIGKRVFFVEKGDNGKVPRILKKGDILGKVESVGTKKLSGARKIHHNTGTIAYISLISIIALLYDKLASKFN